MLRMSEKGMVIEMKNQELCSRAARALLSLQRHSWEQGVTTHAFIDLGDEETAVALARSAVYRQVSDGRCAVIGGNGTVTDPTSPGEALVYAYEKTGDPFFKEAADRLLDWALNKAPRTSDGIVYHVVDKPEIWADSTYMLPPFLAAAGYYEEAVFQLEGYCRLLKDPETGLLRHIWNDGSKSFVRSALWGGGSGWTVASMARILHRLPEKKKDLRERLLAMEIPLLDSAIRVMNEEGLAHNILDDPSSFLELNFSQMCAYAIYTGLADGWLPASYAPVADRIRQAAWRRVDAYGFVQEVCGLPDFDHCSISPEAQAFFLLMEAAEDRYNPAAE